MTSDIAAGAGGSAVTASGTEASGAQSPERGGSRAKRRGQWAVREANWVGLIAALLVLACGILLLWGIWDGNPVAAPFTRVGGETNVETAVDAYRFWPTSPKFVVETSASALPPIMLEAAQCAMVHDAPLLFTSRDPKLQSLVDATIKGWNNPTPTIISIQRPVDLTHCLEMKSADPADINGLSVLPGPYPLVQFPETGPIIPTRQKLAPVVIFAAALGPGFLPDVAVGMALGAHMATTNYPISLVIVPRYLEADQELESQLESQHQLISGGVVLGQTATVPDDTLSLLRQLLTARDGHGVLAQIQANLGSLGPIVAAVLALIGLAVAADQVKHSIKQLEPYGPPPPIDPPPPAGRRTGVRQLLSGVRRIITMAIFQGKTTQGAPVATLTGTYWRSALGDNRKVIVWLRSGTKVAGIVTDWYPPDEELGKDRADVLTNAIVRLTEVTLTREGAHAESEEFEFVLVSVKDIELIAKVSPDRTGSGH